MHAKHLNQINNLTKNILETLVIAPETITSFRENCLLAWIGCFPLTSAVEFYGYSNSFNGFETKFSFTVSGAHGVVLIANQGPHGQTIRAG